MEEKALDETKVAGKRVLVTGSGTGIGREIGLEFARAGADVVFHYAHSSQGALSAAEEARRLGVRTAVLAADFSRVEAVQQMARQAIDFLGGIDILVNNAGITMNRPFEDVTPEQFDTLYHVNIRAMFFATQACMPAMVAQGQGVVINLSSVHAYEGMPEHTVYAGTKGAIVSFTRALAVELALKGIRVNAIAPGSVIVENHYKAVGEIDLEGAGRDIPAGFVGEPRDVAHLAVFLASDAARYIVGQTIIIDGGTTAWLPFCDAFRHKSEAKFGKDYVPGI